MKHWVHAFSTFAIGGPQRRAVDLIAMLGAEVRHTIIAMDGRTECATLIDGASFALREPPGGGVFARLRAMKAALRELSPDLLLTYNWGAIEWLLAARRRGRVVHHEDGFGPDELERPLRRRAWTRRILCRAAQRVIVPSRNLARIAGEHYGLREPHLVYLPNGVDLERFAPTDRAPRARFRFVMVGGLRPEKNQELALRALVRCHDLELLIIGDGPDRAALEARTRELDLAARVEFRGDVDDTAPCYHEADAFLISSATEQMPIALLEAMASGLPAVATDVGDVADMLSEPNRRFVVPPARPDALAQAMSSLAEDRSTARAIGANNRTRVEREFERDRCYGAFLDVYRRASIN